MAGETRRPVADRQAPAAVRRLDPRRAHGEAARRQPAVPDGDRPAIRRELRADMARRRHEQRQHRPHGNRQSAQRRHGRLGADVDRLRRKRRRGGVRLARQLAQLNRGRLDFRSGAGAPHADRLGKRPAGHIARRLPSPARNLLVRRQKGRQRAVHGRPHAKHTVEKHRRRPATRRARVRGERPSAQGVRHPRRPVNTVADTKATEIRDRPQHAETAGVHGPAHAQPRRARSLRPVPR